MRDLVRAGFESICYLKICTIEGCSPNCNNVQMLILTAITFLQFKIITYHDCALFVCLQFESLLQPPRFNSSLFLHAITSLSSCHCINKAEMPKKS